MRIIRRSLFGCALLLLSGVSMESRVQAQELPFPNDSCIRAKVLFPVGSGVLDRSYKDNQVNLLRFLVQLDKIAADTTCVIRRIEVAGSSSPEGKINRNNQLSDARAQSMKEYLVATGKVPAEKIEVMSLGENWSGLRQLVEASEMPRKEVVLALMERYGEDYAGLKNAIIRDADGATWDWMYGHFFPQLRMGAGGACDITLSYDRAAATEPTTTPPTQQAPATVADKPSVTPVEPLKSIRKPLFALKTNLLFDAASLLNIEVEVPIGKHFSIAGELIVPWWLLESRQHCLQIFSGNVEGRYWFGNRTTTPKGKPRQVMTGWFAGIYAGGGYYDLEWNRSGYQGEFFIAAGISGGYAHTINKRGNLRMEYSLGVGYLQTDYRHYKATLGDDQQWHLYRQNDGKFSWFGPTRAKISLVWMLNYNKKGGVK